MIIQNVGKLIDRKKNAVIDQNESARAAALVMCSENVRALTVVDGERIVGVLSESDIVRRCVCEGLEATATKVFEIMTRPPKTIQSTGSLAEALQIMTAGGFHHIPVLDDDDNPVGMISIDDIPDEYRMLLEHYREMRSFKVAY